MKRILKIVGLFSTTVLLFNCGGGSGNGGNEEVVNEAPSKVTLTYPTQNLLCIDNTIPFDWSDATDPNQDNISYKVEIATNRELTNIVKSQTSTTSTATILLDKGKAHYWRVTAVDSKGKEGAPSEVFAFYTKGEGETNIAPFTAELVKPEDEGTISGATIILEWKGADSNTSDTLTYDVYFGEEANPTTLKQENLNTNTLEVSVETGKTYYWKVNTKDNFGAKSIGQIWSFTVN
ncbi:hypothetical protein P8625_11370 [Tenacibaculum tangerinum]|uniref:Fibronectin type-III domain-containing protein n=1 Tax=Tenacibaculum tangerinum TaxID=3038772 RepID=A0ABY8KZL9_9FLAO|nr:hypothetical protein [Tenacibaculum tangerinum]WGH74681.1 hypothetical protein P8625_11370 [Tenacibaculum tangerinum]